MSREWIRNYCMSLPHTTEHFLWKIDLVFKVGGKMYATLVLEPHPVCLAFKCTPEDFDELIERPGIIPAPYSARSKWVALESFDAMQRKELQPRLKQAYDLIFAKLPKKTQRELS
ncbi:MAG TPA: MmcQ/YjbR family DNA-binding protein, partial [Bryobacteraceae bacterium]|nr:MmcQ/YjbR family DNA-binding protein [Bryobacteraceae bacterium]